MDSVVTADEGPVRLLTLNRPESLNSLTADLLELLRNLLEAADRDPAVHAVVITGAGRAFCAGGNMEVLAQAAQDVGVLTEISDAGHRLVHAMAAMRTPVISAVNGVAAGGGIDLALASDLRIGGESAAFAFTTTSIGLLPDMGGSWLLPRLVGPARANELVFRAATVRGHRLAEIGLVNALAPDAELRATATEWAQEIARQAPLAIGFAKGALRAALHSDMETALAREQAAAKFLVSTADFAEGVAAFLEKRSARFSAR